MFALSLSRPDLQSLQVVQQPRPEPGPGELRLRMRAASLNFLDLLVADGLMPMAGYPLTPVCDGAGEVDAIGARVSGWTVGDRALPHLMPQWLAGRQPVAHMIRGVNGPGSAAEYVLVPAAAVAPMPPHLSFEEAATLPIAATTAWNALRAGRIGPGHTVLLLGTGGVSLFALQLAKASGARVLITSSSDAKLAAARQLGADEGINYRTTPDWDAEVLRLTGGQGADLVLETGGTATFACSLNAAAMGATVFVIGLATGAEVTHTVLPILLKTLRLVGNNTGSVADFRSMLAAVAASGLRPVIDSRFELAQAVAAYERQRSGNAFGKVVLRLEDAA